MSIPANKKRLLLYLWKGMVRMSTLTLNNVTYRYRGAQKPAVSNVSCSFGPGKLYAIIGPSGSGKSTLLSMMAGLDLPTEGTITFNGENLAQMDLDRYRRECIAMIFQMFHLFPLLTVLETAFRAVKLLASNPLI